MSNITTTLAEALLRRKELQQKVDQLKTIKDKDIFETKAVRRPAAEGIDDIVAKLPQLSASAVTKEYDFYARALRNVDAVIQRTNWETQVEIPSTAMADFEPEQKKSS